MNSILIIIVGEFATFYVSFLRRLYYQNLMKILRGVTQHIRCTYKETECILVSSQTSRTYHSLLKC
jgi:hypothetical protein